MDFEKNDENPETQQLDDLSTIIIKKFLYSFKT